MTDHRAHYNNDGMDPDWKPADKPVDQELAALRDKVTKLEATLNKVRNLQRYERSKCNEYPECNHRSCWTAYVWSDDLGRALKG